jgi:hypothetical protein
MIEEKLFFQVNYFCCSGKQIRDLINNRGKNIFVQVN